ncbi:MAG: hypothetical protein HYX68_11770 [Planctomycetes bacterium]|nr:hypothetical protein [Planctomycetota bacterium]
MLHRLLAVALTLTLVPTLARADAFDNYINSILAKIPDSKLALKITRLTPELMTQHNRALPGIVSTFIVVKTNDDRYAKLLVLHGRQKLSDKESVPIMLIDRYVTYREGEERTIHALGKNVRLFDGFRFNLDLGQVVPKNVAADLRVGVKDNFPYLETVGKAQMYIVTKHLPEANPVKPAKLVVGAKFETRYFNGAYKLHDDGRRSGTLHLKVDAKGEVSGHFYSDKDGQKYEVSGKVSPNPQHKIDFFITYPRTMQFFTGFLFTGNGAAITGTSRLEMRETGFYAVREK